MNLFVLILILLVLWQLFQTLERNWDKIRIWFLKRQIRNWDGDDCRCEICTSQNTFDIEDLKPEKTKKL